MRTGFITDKNGEKYLISGRKKYRIISDTKKARIIEAKKVKEQKQKEKQIKKKRQQIVETLRKFNYQNKKEILILYPSWGRGVPVNISNILLVCSMPDKYHSKRATRIIKRYKKFWAKNALYIDRYLCRCLHRFQQQKEENEENSGQWFNLEDVKNANDLRQCWNFIREWKTYFSNYKKLKWSEKTERKVISEKMWSKIRDYYYKRLKQNKKIDKAKCYEIIAGEFNKKYKPLLPGKRPPVPQEDAFWRKFYSIKDKYSKKLTTIKIK